MTGLKRLMLALCALTLAGCAQVRPQPAPAPASPPPAVECPPSPLPASVAPVVESSALDELLRESAGWHQLPPEVLRQQYAQASQAVQQSTSAVNRMRMALLWLMPNTPFHDPASAWSTLRDLSVSRPGSDAELTAFAAALLDVAEDGRRTADELTLKLHEQQKRADALQEKVDAIRNMERDLMRRISP